MSRSCSVSFWLTPSNISILSQLTTPNAYRSLSTLAHVILPYNNKFHLRHDVPTHFIETSALSTAEHTFCTSYLWPSAYITIYYMIQYNIHHNIIYSKIVHQKHKCIGTEIRFGQKNKQNREIQHFQEWKTKFIMHKILTKIMHLDKMFNKISYSGWKKKNILDKIWLVSLKMLVAQYKISAY